MKRIVRTAAKMWTRKAEQKGNRGEREKGKISVLAASVFQHLPVSVSPYVTFCPASRLRRGFSLIEVLASIGVISIGLFGLASLLPVGLVTIFEATKADRAGNCGRAAMRDVVVRRMLDSSNWTSIPSTPSFLIDPLGVSKGMTNNFGGTNIPRVSLKIFNAAAFTSTDDLIVSLPEDMNPPRLPGRPLNLDGSNNPAPLFYEGAYSWFATVVPVVPTLNNPTRYTVSVVVCYRRNFTAAGEQAIAVSTFYDSAKTLNAGGPSVAPGGGSVQLSGPIGSGNSIRVREGDWVALCNSAGLCRWYRVVAIDDIATNLTLAGPDWPNPSAGSDKLVAVGQDVVGVYTTTIDLDTDVTWKN